MSLRSNKRPFDTDNDADEVKELATVAEETVEKETSSFKYRLPLGLKDKKLNRPITSTINMMKCRSFKATSAMVSSVWVLVACAFF